QILRASQSSFRNFRQQALPYVGYLLLKKGDEALDRSTSLVQKIEQDFSDEMLKAKEANAQIASTLESARAAAGKVGVTRHSTDFAKIANTHKIASRIWLVATAVLIAGVAVFSWYFVSHQLPEGDLRVAA